LSVYGLILGGVVAVSGCAEIQQRPAEDRKFRAYGTNWTYHSVVRDIKRWGFNSPHGIFGVNEGTEQDVYLLGEKGEKTAVHQNILALQKDGSYKKVECCYSQTTMVAVYNFDDKLVLRFLQTRENVTDCYVYPAGQPDANLAKGERARYVTFFGEFDPKANVFRVRHFYPGGVSFEESRAKLGPRATLEQTTELIYQRRAPFHCDR
jgi:hypothetical protein